MIQQANATIFSGVFAAAQAMLCQERRENPGRRLAI